MKAKWDMSKTAGKVTYIWIRLTDDFDPWFEEKSDMPTETDSSSEENLSEKGFCERGERGRWFQRKRRGQAEVDRQVRGDPVWRIDHLVEGVCPEEVGVARHVPYINSNFLK